MPLLSRPTPRPSGDPRKVNDVNTVDQIKKDIADNKVMLFIKGEKGAPQCGFSSAVMDVFDKLGVAYETKNVLADPELREAIKTFSNWPTIPQIYINGEFIGGCDIIRELSRSGELENLVKSSMSS